MQSLTEDTSNCKGLTLFVDLASWKEKADEGNRTSQYLVQTSWCGVKFMDITLIWGNDTIY